MKVLVLNCGSSSVKYQLIETGFEAIRNNEDHALAKGAVERIGTSSAIHSYVPSGGEKSREVSEILEHAVAIQHILTRLTDRERGVIQDVGQVQAVGHRVVHGGERFTMSALMDDDVVRGIEECTELAPLHNPHNLRGYKAAFSVLPDVPHVAVFDTAYHQTMPAHAYLYGLPYVLYKRHGIRRYGFHGTSHRYVGWRSQKLLAKPREQTRLISCHLGNGASVCAIDHGKSVDTSMGFTPLEGLIMGTRSGDIDPALIFYILHKEDLTEQQASTMLNKHSGLQGISGLSNDIGELLAEEREGNDRAQLAIDCFAYRVKKYIAAYAAAMGGVDAVLMAAGIGENAPEVRSRCLTGLEYMGIELDESRNAATVGIEGKISTEDSRVQVWVIPTDEERIIARDTLRLLHGRWS